MHRNNRHCEIRGVWSVSEHERFIEAIAAYPCGPWKLVTEYIGTRSLKQVQTHAQKYQQKLLRQQRGLRKRKTKLKRPEHRVDATTLDQFTHTTIVRYAKRVAKEQDDDPETETEPIVVADSPSSFSGSFDRSSAATVVAGADVAIGEGDDDWELMTRNLSQDVDLMDFMAEIDDTPLALQPPKKKQKQEQSHTKKKEKDQEQDDQEEVEFPRMFDDLYDPPKDWNAWQFDELLQPPHVDNTLNADKGACYLDGSELFFQLWTV